MGDSSSETLVSKANEENFVFAFNDFDFSDRVLRLEISPDEESADSGRNLRGEKYNEWFSSIQAPCSKDSEPDNGGTKVRALHITSAILAAKSPFFYKLFKNGMKESQQKSDVSFKINASEEATLMDLLNFMYGNSMSAKTIPDLVDVLIAADKFEVVSCMRYCVEMLLKFPMALDSALFYLELPSSVLVSEIVKPLIDSAKQYVASCYKDFTTKSTKDELKNLFPSKTFQSHLFCVRGKQFTLLAQCCTHVQGQFGLFVCKAIGTETCTLDFEFALMTKSSKEFTTKHKANNLTIGDSGLGSRDLLGIPWTEFISDDSDYFINGVLHIRAELTLKIPKA